MALIKRKIPHKDGSHLELWYGVVSLPLPGQYYANGKPRYTRRVFSIGDVTGKDKISKRRAQQKYDEVKQDLIQEHEAAYGDNVTLQGFEPIYFTYVREISKKKSWERDKLSLGHLGRILGPDTFLTDINRVDLSNYQLKRISEGAAHGTINRECACLKHLLNVAALQGKFNKATPFLGFKFLPEQPKGTVISVGDEERLHDFLPPHQWVIVDFALNTACRASEIINLKWEYINLDKRIIIIPLSYTKEKAIKQIDINDYLFGLLSQLKKANGSKNEYVFLTPEGKPYKSVHSLKFFTRACKKLGIKGVTFHTLRHTSITRMLGENQPLDSVGRIAGHRNISTTMRYAHRNPADKQAVNSLNKYRKSKIFRTKYRTKMQSGDTGRGVNKR